MSVAEHFIYFGALLFWMAMTFKFSRLAARCNRLAREAAQEIVDCHSQVDELVIVSRCLINGSRIRFQLHGDLELEFVIKTLQGIVGTHAMISCEEWQLHAITDGRQFAVNAHEAANLLLEYDAVEFMVLNKGGDQL